MQLDEASTLLTLLGDPTRVRLLSLLSHEELSVAELTRITELSQSRVSTHLGKLRDAGFVRDRRSGASAFYAVVDGALPDLWDGLSDTLDDPMLVSDQKRCDQVVAARDARGWPDAIAGRMERHYSPGRTWESLARAFAGLVSLGDVLDVGAGDGTVASLLSPHARSYTCLDRSEKVVDAAQRRLKGLPGIEVVKGDMHELPFSAPSFDTVLLLNVLQYSKQPERVIAEAARTMRPGGTSVVVTLDEHQHGAITESYGHLNDGLSPSTLEHCLKKAELAVDRCEVTSRERRKPHFRVITAFAHRRDR